MEELLRLPASSQVTSSHVHPSHQSLKEEVSVIHTHPFLFPSDLVYLHSESQMLET